MGGLFTCITAEATEPAFQTPKRLQYLSSPIKHIIQLLTNVIVVLVLYGVPFNS